ncbi:MAG: MFS transporter [Myxococcota bacterium]|nr:MFS transporter [Myxococcota bacterium]
MRPVIPLASFWLLWMGGMGLVFPFQSLYFKENAGLTGFELGLVLAIRPLLGMIFQPIWGQVSDRTGRRSLMLGLLCLGAALGLSLIPLAGGLLPLMGVIGLTAAFGASVMSVGSAVSMAALSPATERFGQVRSFGTLGFAVMVLGFPFLLDRFQEHRGLVAEPGGPSEPGLGIIFTINAAFAVLAAISAFRLPGSASLSVRSRRGDLAQLMRHGPFLRLLAFCFLAYFFNHATILLMPLLVESRGGGLTELSLMWIPMLLLEVPLVFYSGRVLGRLGGRGLLALGVGADGLRWVLCVAAPSLGWMYGFQLLHGVVVVGLIIGVSLYVDAVVPERLRATGQTVVGMIGISLASTLSALTQGALLDRFGIDAPYWFGGIGGVVLACLIPVLLPKARRPED